MFSEINYMEQDYMFLNRCFLYKNYAVHNINIKARVRNTIQSLY